MIQPDASPPPSSTIHASLAALSLTIGSTSCDIAPWARHAVIANPCAGVAPPATKVAPIGVSGLKFFIEAGTAWLLLVRAAKGHSMAGQPIDHRLHGT